MGKEYKSEWQIKLVLFFILLFLILFIASIVFFIMKKDTFVLISGIFTSILFEFIFFLGLLGVKKNKLIIESDKLVFYFKTNSEYKEYNTFNSKGLEIKFDEISSIIFIFLKGDIIYSADTTFVKFNLKNNKDFETCFSFLGRKKEKEVFTFLESNFNIKNIKGF